MIDHHHGTTPQNDVYDRRPGGRGVWLYGKYSEFLDALLYFWEIITMIIMVSYYLVHGCFGYINISQVRPCLEPLELIVSQLINY
jgi:hypothetical protein